MISQLAPAAEMELAAEGRRIIWGGLIAALVPSRFCFVAGVIPITDSFRLAETSKSIQPNL